MTNTDRWLASRAITDAVAAPERVLRAIIVESGIHPIQAARDWSWRVLWRIDRDAAVRTYVAWMSSRYGGTMSTDEASMLLDAHLAHVR